ncbi:MAG: GGDEF domain-containing protein [Acidobacteria bacterium]|nr:GGDEF domain-containing protein [Acidobacteriota bacterium]
MAAPHRAGDFTLPAEPRREPFPQTRGELEAWIRMRLDLPSPLQDRLLVAIDEVFATQQRRWQESKEEAIQALLAGFTERLADLRTELSARDATVSSIARYFEDLVETLSERSKRDSKTKLMTFDWFMEQLESFLELEQRVRWCAVGLVDIANFKWYNDSFGHALGDRIIEQVAHLLREQVRSDDLLAVERPSDNRRPDLHARFGGDEFCFLIPDVADSRTACAIADRFREGVERFDWADLDPRLAEYPIRVDVGVVCLWMGKLGSRRFIARRLARELIEHADRLMYSAKSEEESRVYPMKMAIERGTLVELADAETPEE